MNERKELRREGDVEAGSLTAGVCGRGRPPAGAFFRRCRPLGVALPGVNAAVFLVGLAFLVAPVLVAGAGEVVVLLQEDFDSDEDPWWYAGGAGSATIRDGYLFLNLSATDQSCYAKLDGARLGGEALWQHAGLEVRLRCIGDLVGMWSWGLSDFVVRPYRDSELALQATETGDRALFNYFSPQHTSNGWAGLQALVAKVSNRWLASPQINARFSEPLSGIDMTEWHTYTILFEDGEERYLVDGQHVATSPSVPESAMGVEIQVGNECWDPNKIAQREGEHSPLGGDYVVAGIDSEESIQVDYVKVFWSAETFNSMSEEVSELFLQAEEAVSELDETGLGDTSPIASAIQGAADSWERYHCDVRPVLQNIVSLPGLCQNLPFPYAEQLISGLDESNLFVARFEQTLTEAEAAWNNALASLRNPSTFDSYYDMAIERLTEIRTQIEAHNEILGGNLFEVAEGDLAGIADNRTRMMLAVKLDLAKGVWESGDYSAAKVYLDQIGEPGLALALLLSLLYPVLRRV